MNIILIGFMGSGKTSVGRRLAGRLRRELVDTDLLVEERARKSIKDIFEQEGEPAFRQLESQVVEEVSRRDGLVIACGGGVILNPRNVELLRRKGTIFYLKGDLEMLFERVRGGNERPLLNVGAPQEEFERIFSERRQVYEASADVVVEINGKEEAEIIVEILRSVGGEG